MLNYPQNKMDNETRIYVRNDNKRHLFGQSKGLNRIRSKNWFSKTTEIINIQTRCHP